MAEAKTDQEPSIEEILESIRQIISDDAAPAAVAAAAPVAPAAMPADAPVAAPAAENADDDDDILDLTDKAVPDIIIDLQDQPDQPRAPAPAFERPVSTSDGGALLSAATADISAHAMARLLAGNVAVEREMPGRVGNVTLEDMTRELLHPLLKNWLDQNLPGIIERMVAKEIEKISRMAMKQ